MYIDILTSFFFLLSFDITSHNYLLSLSSKNIKVNFKIIFSLIQVIK